jgi:glycosyltransferase involved in cell wall biosynthesis
VLSGDPVAAANLAAIERRVASLGMEADVRLLGRTSHEDLDRIMDEADVFVHPTLNDAFPLVVLEAMARGLPVVATREGAIPEMVVDGETALLVEKGDVAGLAAAMKALAADPRRMAAMSAAGLARYRALYTPARFEMSMRAAIEAALAVCPEEVPR